MEDNHIMYWVAPALFDQVNTGEVLVVTELSTGANKLKLPGIEYACTEKIASNNIIMYGIPVYRIGLIFLQPTGMAEFFLLVCRS